MLILKLKSLLHSDFAFRQDSTLAALPLVIAFLTVLSICMTHSAAYIKQVTLSGSEALQQRLHLHLPYNTTTIQTKQLYEELALIDGIAVIEEVSRTEMQQFLGDWLSIGNDVSEDFPLPTILDITIHPEANRDVVKGQIQYYLDSSIDNALLESYDETIAAFNRSSNMIKTGIYILGFVVMIAITLIVVITSRINLGVHRNHIEILHHLGANDHYINRQFIKRAALISAQGVLGGTLLSLLFIELIKSQFDSGLLPGSASELQGIWIYYIINPILLMVLVLIAAWVSIEAQLKKMH